MDVDAVELEFKERIDTSQPLEKYFECQQLCQGLLKDTKESISETSMKHTTISHLQRIAHMVRNTKDYKRDKDMHGTGSYENLCNHFIARENVYVDDQNTLAQGDIVNSVVTNRKLEELQYEMANLVTKNSELEDALITIAGAMEHQKKVADTVIQPILLSNKSDMENLFVAFLVEEKPPEASSEHSTSVI